MTEHSTEEYVPRRSRPVDRSKRRGSSHQGTDNARYVMFGAAGVVAFVLLLVLIDASSSFGRIHPGVSVGGVQVGGKSAADAVVVLKSELPAKAAAAPVIVVSGDKTWKVAAKDLGVGFDYGKLADDAMAVGRSGGAAAAIGARMRAWFGGVSLPASATADPQKLQNEIDKIAGKLDADPQDAQLKVTANGVTMTPSATGVTVDRKALERALLGAYASAARTVSVKADTAQPKITDAAAKRAQGVAEQMISAPATVTYQAKSWPLSVAEIAKMITFQQVETTGTGSATWVLVPQIAASEASKTLLPKIGSALGNPPVNARFSTSGGKVKIIPSKDGVGADVEDFSAALTTVLKNPSRERVVNLRTKITPPSLTTQQAESMGIRERIATFSTTYNPGVTSRVNNIHVLGSALDGKLIPPGGTFSFNGAVGERTAAKGYQEAPAIVKGKLVPQLGGGICQVATTLFNAVFLSGFPVTERINHSFYISHYPTGRDATVSWGGPDLRWKNPTNSWVLVSVSMSSDSITISLYGTDPGYQVSYNSPTFKGTVPYKTITVSDPTMPAGAKDVVDPGEMGGKVVVTRTVKDASGAVIRTDTFTSSYTPKNETVNVGTKGSKTATSTPAPKKS